MSPSSSRTFELPEILRLLVAQKHFSLEDAKRVTERSSGDRYACIQNLFEGNYISAKNFALFAARAFDYEFLDLETYNLAALPIDYIRKKNLLNERAIPIAKTEKNITIAVSDPSNRALLNNLRFRTGLPIVPVVVEAPKLVQLFRHVGQQLSTGSNQPTQAETVATKTQKRTPAIPPTSPPKNTTPTPPPAGAEGKKNLSRLIGDTADESPAAKIIQDVLLSAIEDGASDVHFEPYEDSYRIRVRLDGQLLETAAPPSSLKEQLASRIKIIARMDISEKRLPQDGRIRITEKSGRNIDLRISTLPVTHGEKIAIRILDPQKSVRSISSLGFSALQEKHFLTGIKHTSGMILITGATGSGKTVTLYSALKLLNHPNVNISTAEDPTETSMLGVNQVDINSRIGLSFSTTLRAFLRQDPDILMVGEIRDLETAEISIEAAQTGHLVLSSLHTNDAPATITRLRNMGIPAYNIASSIKLITSQMLIRTLCRCKKAIDIPQHALRSAGFDEQSLSESWQAYAPTGCPECKQTGYRGRTAIYEVMPISDKIRQIIVDAKDDLELQVRRQAHEEGIFARHHSALQKVKQGVTSLEEALISANPSYGT